MIGFHALSPLYGAETIDESDFLAETRGQSRPYLRFVVEVLAGNNQRRMTGICRNVELLPGHMVLVER